MIQHRRTLSVLMLAALVLVARQVTDGRAGTAQAQTASSMETLLNPDGTLNLSSSLSGSVDATGWTMTTAGSGAPHFARGTQPPGPAASARTAAPLGDEQWDDRFGTNPPDIAGVFAVAITGTDVYVSGEFTGAGGITVANIAKWDGAAWSPLGSGIDTYVKSITISGTDVYVGGGFSMAGGNLAAGIARWNGSAWSPMAGGVGGGEVDAIVIGGTDVYAGGRFNGPGNNIARWDGAAWSPLGAGLDNPVSSIVKSDSDLYVAGQFTNAGGNPANRVARWDGNAWSPLSNGLNATVNTLVISGTELYAGGRFTSTGTMAAKYVARWNGSTWSGVGSGMNGNVFGLAISGTTLYAGGDFGTAGGNPAANLASWDGSAWSPVSGGLSGKAYALAAGGGMLSVGGAFAAAGNQLAGRIAGWNGSSWSALGVGVCCSTNDQPELCALAIHGADVYIGGLFYSIGTMPANNIARWNGVSNTWSALGAGVNNDVQSIAISGTDVYVGGDFSLADGQPAANIARWDGSQWSALGAGLVGANYPAVSAIAQAGNYIYAGGGFSVAGHTGPGCCIARWDGSTWYSMGSGANSSVLAIAASGNDVYIGGYFTAVARVNASRVARWNGSTWSNLGADNAVIGNGVDGSVRALSVRGTNVYAAGDFLTAHNATGVDVSAQRVARWNGTSWSALGSGIDNTVFAVTTLGNSVYAAGRFSTAGGNPATNIARWDGANWTALGSGIADHPFFPLVGALATDGRAIYVGGSFTIAGNKPSYDFARWNALPDSSYLPAILR